MGSLPDLEKPHAVCIPFPAQGHINPMMKLAKLLHSRGFHVTFVLTHYNHARLLRSRGPHALDGLPSFRFVSIPDGLPPSDADSTQSATPSIATALAPSPTSSGASMRPPTEALGPASAASCRTGPPPSLWRRRRRSPSRRCCFGRLVLVGFLGMTSMPALCDKAILLSKANGQAEATNRAILDGIKKRLDLAKGRWAEELPAVLWAHRTTPRRSTGESPFALAYGTDAVIPLEIGLPGVRTSAFQQGGNDEALGVNLDLLQEKRDASAIRMAAYQQELIKLHGRQIRPRPISVGDFVLRKVLGNTKDPTEGKLGPNWEGPYRVTADLGNGSFKLEDMDGREIPRTWNVFNLKRFYV